MGRPKKEKKLAETVYVRLSAEEMEALDQRRGAVSRSSFLRAAFLKVPVPRPIPAANREAYTELARLGNLLNQVARRMNRGESEAASEAAALVAEIRLELLGLKS